MKNTAKQPAKPSFRLHFPLAIWVLLSFLLLGTTENARAGEGYFYKEGTIWLAAQEGNLPQVKKMLAANPALLNSRETGFYKDTLLEAAAHGGYAAVFNYFRTYAKRAVRLGLWESRSGITASICCVVR